MYIGDPPIHRGEAYCPRCGRPMNGTGLMQLCNCIGNRITWPEMPKQVPLPHVIAPVPQAAKLVVQEESMAKKYPKYYKDVSDISVLDVYGVHKLFAINDPSGAIQHASKKLLLSGVRTGGKSAYDDIREARDTLNRWLELNKPK